MKKLKVLFSITPAGYVVKHYGSKGTLFQTHTIKHKDEAREVLNYYARLGCAIIFETKIN